MEFEPKPKVEQTKKIENLESLEREILDDRFKLLYIGKDYGNFRATSNGFIDRLEQARKDLGLQLIFAPNLEFTKRTGSLTENHEQVFFVGPKGEPVKYKEELEGVVRTFSKADGGIIFLDELESMGIDSEKVALSAFNADCPFIIGYDEEKRAVFSLHAGLGCLHKPGEKTKRTIFQQLIEEHGLNPEKIKVFVTAGIQKCCYGRNDQQSPFPNVFEVWGDAFRSVATKGKRVGQESLDLSGLIEHAVESSGVPKENIEVDKNCTSCDGNYWSNVKGEGGRNLIIVHLNKLKKKNKN